MLIDVTMLIVFISLHILHKRYKL